MKKILVVVDPQNDFCPGGALAVPEGNIIMDKINAIFNLYDLVIISKEEHPANHLSFTICNPGLNVMDTFEGTDGNMMIVWPPHCVKGTEGARFHPDLKVPKSAYIIIKGTGRYVHPFSVYGGETAYGEDVDSLLSEVAFADGDDDDIVVDIVGLTTDYSVEETALDCNLINETRVLVDYCRGISKETTKKSLSKMSEAGIKLVYGDVTA